MTDHSKQNLFTFRRNHGQDIVGHDLLTALSIFRSKLQFGYGVEAFAQMRLNGVWISGLREDLQ